MRPPSGAAQPRRWVAKGKGKTETAQEQHRGRRPISAQDASPAAKGKQFRTHNRRCARDGISGVNKWTLGPICETNLFADLYVGIYLTLLLTF